MSYSATRRASATPEKYGTGMIEGVAAAESADNAVVPSSLIPLFALGIPGSVIAAILIAAFILHGLTPGPLMFVQQPRLVSGLYASMICASVILLIIGYFGLRLFAQIIRVPLRLLIPGVLLFCCVGAFMETGSIFSIYIMLIFAVLGYLARALGFSFVTFLIGFVIGPNLEFTFRQSIQLLNRDPVNMIHHPIAVLFVLMTIATVWLIARQKRKPVASNIGTNTDTNAPNKTHREELK
jgi:putative tricarboxylic transport membrane protein